MKLYYQPLSTFSRRVRMQLLEKDLSVEEQLVRMEQGEHKSDAFRKLNPYGRVPVLVDDELVLYESSAIMEYIEQRQPTPALLPTDAKQRALVSMHVKLCDLEVGTHGRALFFPRRFFPRERWNVAEQDHARAAIAAHLAIVSAQLGEREYLVGEHFSLADLAYCIVTPFVSLFELEPPANVTAWFARIEARPSAKATFPAR
jgi:glutathione S-transferase